MNPISCNGAFNLKYTVESGQPLTFHSQYSKRDNVEHLEYVTTKGKIEIRLSNSRLSYLSEGGYTRRSAGKEVMERFGLRDDLQDIYKRINTDPFMAKAISEFRGLRITQNDPWETTLCFIMSQFNNIKRIKGIIQRMIGEFGYEFDGIRLFPAPEAIAASDIARIRSCGTGFRDKYIRSAAEQFAHSFNPERLYGMKYEAAKESLMELDGIGDKVADCILLFGYGKKEAFPIDVWIKRVMERTYFNGRKRSVQKIHEFADLRWPGLQGYAQQYLFHYARSRGIK